MQFACNEWIGAWKESLDRADISRHREGLFFDNEARPGRTDRLA
jgi:hypothetical protein